MQRNVASPALDLLVQVQEAKSKLPLEHVAGVALNTLQQCVELGVGPYGNLLLGLHDIFEEAIFSSEKYSSDAPSQSSSLNKHHTSKAARYRKMAYFTLAKRAQDKIYSLEEECLDLRAINKELRNKIGMASAEVSSARVELKTEVTRQSNAQLHIEYLQEKLRAQDQNQKMKDAESHASFISMANEIKMLKHKEARSNIVIRELGNYRDRLESVRTRFRVLGEHRMSAQKFGAVNNSNVKRSSFSKRQQQLSQRQKRESEARVQVSQLSNQLRDLYYDLVDQYEKSRTNLDHTKEHLENLRRKFARDAGSLIYEKERLDLHSLGELSSDGKSKNILENIASNAKARTSTLAWLKVKEGGMWLGYAHLCQHLHDLHQKKNNPESGPEDFGTQHNKFASCPPALVALDPPSWPHPMPSLQAVYQEILVIFASANAATQTNIVCTEAKGTTLQMPSQITESTSQPRFTPFSDYVTLHFVSQYEDKRVALAAMHSFISQISTSQKKGPNFSHRASLFAKALSGKLSISACLSFAEVVRVLSPVKEHIRLDSAIGRSVIVHLIYGDGFATCSELVDMENKFGDFCEKQGIKDKYTSLPDEKTTHNQTTFEKGGGRPENSTYDVVLEFVCNDLICGEELRLQRAKSELKARDLINSGTMRLTRFQDAVHSITKHHKRRVGRKELTKLFRIASYEVNAKTMLFDESDNEEDTVDAESEANNHSTYDSIRENKEGAEAKVDLLEEKKSEVYKKMMMMPVSIDNALSNILAFTYWAGLPESTLEKINSLEAELRGDVSEEIGQLSCASVYATQETSNELVWSSAQPPRSGQSLVTNITSATTE